MEAINGKMKLPDQIRIAPHDHKVTRKKRREMPLIDGEKPNGYYDKDGLEICVLAGTKLSKTQENLTHETLHGIWPAGYGFEEEIILDLTPKLLQLIQDNPKLIAFLAQKSSPASSERT